MENKQQKLTEIKSKSQNTGKKGIIIGSILATFIAIIPYLFYLYESVPNVKIWNTFIFTFDSSSYENAQTVAWLLMGKIIPIYILFIWFFTCKHWWYHVILVPIAMYIFQTMSILNQDLSYVDEFQLAYLIPVMAIIIPSIYLIRARIFNRINEANKSMEELEEELMLTPKNFWGKIKDYF